MAQMSTELKHNDGINGQPNSPNLLTMFNSLFNYNKNNINNGTEVSDIDKDTGLFLSNSLNYSLRTCLCLRDNKWVLCMLDIDNLKLVNNNLGINGANFKIGEIGRIIFPYSVSGTKKIPEETFTN